MNDINLATSENGHAGNGLHIDSRGGPTRYLCRSEIILLDIVTRSRSFSSPWIYEIAKKRYQQGGLGDLVMSAPKYAYEHQFKRWFLLQLVRNRIITRDELKQLTERNGMIQYWGRTERFALEYPTQDGSPPELVEVLGTYTAERPFICEVPNVRLLGPTPVGITESNEIILETASASEMHLSYFLIDLLDQFESNTELKSYIEFIKTFFNIGSNGNCTTAYLSSAFLLTPRWANYYHWVLEYLPKIRLLERYQLEFGINPTVIIKSNPPSWMIESLRLVGCDIDRCVQWDVDEAQVDRLIIPIHRNHLISPPDKLYKNDFNPSPADYHWLRNRMLSRFSNENTASYSSRIYISRRDARERRVANEANIMEVLAPLGFVSYTPGQMTVLEQVKLFSQADIIVAPHGAGLVNMIYSDDVSVVELIPSKPNNKKFEAYYFCLAIQLGFDYRRIVCKTERGETVVNTDELQRTVAEIL